MKLTTGLCSHSALWPQRSPRPWPSPLQPALVLWFAPSGLFRGVDSYSGGFPGRERALREAGRTGSGLGVPTWTKLILLIAWTGARAQGSSCVCLLAPSCPLAGPPGCTSRMPVGSGGPWSLTLRLGFPAAAYGSTCAAPDSHWVAAKIAPAVAEPLARLVAGGQACRGLEPGVGWVWADPGVQVWQRWCPPSGPPTSVPSGLLGLFLLKEGWV